MVVFLESGFENGGGHDDNDVNISQVGSLSLLLFELAIIYLSTMIRGAIVPFVH